MDAALGIINVVGKKLLDCKRAYDALAADCEDLLAVLQAMEHLLRERSKEKRLEGAIQQQFMKALLELRSTLDTVTETMQGSGKVALWCGTMVGKGAAKASKQLQRHVSLLKDLLAIADAEAGNVTASAVEEIAGGAAGKLIPHEGMRSFWREQFKNDFQLSWDQFLSGLRKFDHELQQTFNESLPDVLRALRLTLDPTRDGMISVNEFAGFLKGSSLLHAGADIVEVLKFQFTGTRHLLPSIAVTHHQQLTACATNDHSFATGDAAGFIKFYVLLRDQVAHTGFAFINAAPTAMAFAEYEEKAHLLAGFAGHCVVIDCASYEIVATFDTFPNGVRSIAVAGDFVLLAAPSPESRVAVYRRVDRPGEGEPITLACQGHLVHSATPREVESAGDGRHCITWTVESGVMVWDFRSKVLVHRLPGSSFCAGFCARPYVDLATKEPRCAVDVFMPPTELHWDDVLAFAGKRIDAATIVESPVMARSSAVLLADSPRDVSVAFNSHSHGVTFGWFPDRDNPAATAADLESDEFVLPRGMRPLMIRGFRRNRFVNAIVLGSISGKPATFLIKPPSDNADEAARGNPVVWPSARVIGGSSFWLGHQRRAMRMGKRLPWICSQPAVATIATKDDGGPYIITSLVDRAIHIYNPDGELVHEQELGFTGRFLEHVQFIVSGTDKHADDVFVLSTDGVVLRYNFAPPFAIGADRGTSKLAGAVAELTVVADFCKTKLRPENLQGVLRGLDHLSPMARAAVSRHVAPLGFTESSRFTSAHVALAYDAVTNARTELQLELAAEEAADDFKPPPFMQLLHDAQEKPVVDTNSGGGGEKAPASGVDDGDRFSHAETASSASDVIRPSTAAKPTKSPNGGKASLPPDGRHASRFTNPKRWAEPAARLFLTTGSPNCLGCNVRLRRKAVAVQYCLQCMITRHGGDATSPTPYVFKHCDRCDALIRSTRGPLCITCLDDEQKAMSLIPFVAVPYGRHLLVGAIAARTLDSYGPTGHLFKVDAETLTVVDKITDCVSPAFDAMASSSAFGGFAVSPLGYDRIAFFEAGPKKLTESLAAEVPGVQLMQSACLVADRKDDEAMLLAAAALTSDIVIFRVTVESTAPLRLNVDQLRVFKPPVPAMKLLLTPRFLCACLRTGAMRVYTLRPTSVPVLADIQGHSTLRITRAAVLEDRFITFTSDGIANIVPRKVFHQMEDIAELATGVRREFSASSMRLRTQALLGFAGHAETPKVVFGSECFVKYIDRPCPWMELNASFKNDAAVTTLLIKDAMRRLTTVDVGPSRYIERIAGEASSSIRRVHILAASDPPDETPAAAAALTTSYGQETTRHVEIGSTVSFDFPDAIDHSARGEAWLAFRIVTASEGVARVLVSGGSTTDAEASAIMCGVGVEVSFARIAMPEDFDGTVTIRVEGRPGGFVVIAVPPKKAEGSVETHRPVLYVPAL